MTNIEISVLMPVYNAEKFLKDSILSILNQTYQNFEFLIIDDGSTDNSLEVIKKFKDKRIVLLENKKNKGIVYSLNKGLKIAKGKYLARMDADDIAYPERLQNQYDFMENNPQIDVLGSDYKCFGNSNSVVKMPQKHEEIVASMFFHNSIAHPTVFLRLKKIKEFNIFYENTYLYVEDYELWTRERKRLQFTNIDKILLKYRVHSFQTGSTHIIKQIKNTNKIKEIYLSELYPEISLKEKEIFFKATSFNVLSTLDEIKVFNNLLKKLYVLNIDKNFYSKRYFYKKLQQFWDFQYSQTAKISLHYWFVFFKSLFFKTSKISFKEKWMIFFRNDK